MTVLAPAVVPHAARPSRLLGLLGLSIVPCLLALNVRGRQHAGIAQSLLGACQPAVGGEAVDYAKFRKTFDSRIDSARKMDPTASKFLSTHLLDADEAPSGLWLKFGVDMSCDAGACDKFGPLGQHAEKRADGTRVYGFDWFQGLPEIWRPGFGKGVFDRKGRIPEPPRGVQWVKGKYQDTLPQFLSQHNGDKIGYLLIDSDLCSSAAFILDAAWPQLADRALIYFDEIMNFPSFERGELLAFYRFLKNTHLDYEVVMAAADFEYSPKKDRGYNQQAAFRLKRNSTAD